MGDRRRKAEGGGRRLAGSIIFMLGFWVMTSVVSHAEIIDRILAVAGGHIITLSDLLQERKVQSILGDEQIEDDGVLLKQIIEQHLIENQIAEYPGTEATDAEVDVELAKTPDRGGVSRDALREAVRRRIRISKYFQLRFRQFIRPTDDDVQKYYENVFVPEARDRGMNPVPALEQVVDAVRSNITEEQLNREMNVWLETIRRRTDIEILK